MPKITFLPQSKLKFEGKTVEAKPGQTILEVGLLHGVPIEHACEMVCACSTCHVIVRKGFESLTELDEAEEDMLDNAWGLEACSRLSCQAIIGDVDLVVEIPQYTRNVDLG